MFCRSSMEAVVICMVSCLFILSIKGTFMSYSSLVPIFLPGFELEPSYFIIPMIGSYSISAENDAWVPFRVPLMTKPLVAAAFRPSQYHGLLPSLLMYLHLVSSAAVATPPRRRPVLEEGSQNSFSLVRYYGSQLGLAYPLSWGIQKWSSRTPIIISASEVDILL